MRHACDGLHQSVVCGVGAFGFLICCLAVNQCAARALVGLAVIALAAHGVFTVPHPCNPFAIGGHGLHFSVVVFCAARQIARASSSALWVMADASLLKSRRTSSVSGGVSMRIPGPAISARQKRAMSSGQSAMMCTRGLTASQASMRACSIRNEA